MVKYFLTLILGLLLIMPASSQQTSLFSQYMFNGLAINPAYAGTHDLLNMTFLARKQWLGVDGAPSTMTFSAHTPLKNEKVSLGTLFYADKIGIFRQYSFNGVYAYRINLSDAARLSFGLQAGVNNYVARYTELTSRDPNDPAISVNDVSGFSPSFGAGIYFYTNRFYAGLSSPYLMNNLMGNKQITKSFSIKSTYFFTTGAVFKLSDALKLKPSILVKYVYGAPVQADFNTNLLIKEVLWLGASIRNFSSLNFLVQFNITEQLRIGYDYDVNLNVAPNIYGGSHEVMINYLFSFSKSKVVTPRYF